MHTDWPEMAAQLSGAIEDGDDGCDETVCHVMANMEYF